MRGSLARLRAILLLSALKKKEGCAVSDKVKAWLVALMILALYGVVGEMECRDLEAMNAPITVVAGK
jgi:hypothetical protein